MHCDLHHLPGTFYLDPLICSVLMLIGDLVLISWFWLIYMALALTVLALTLASNPGFGLVIFALTMSQVNFCPCVFCLTDSAV